MTSNQSRSLNTLFSYAFRASVAVHILSLGVLFFVLRNTFVGLPHVLIEIALTVMMALVAVLFVADMVTRRAETRSYSKAFDAVVGGLWCAFVTWLILLSLR